MPRPRVLALGLDGLELSLVEQFLAAGEMPALAELRRRAVRFRLDHGPAQRTGLAWEHVASGLSPEAGGRWAAVEFDPATYTAWQEGARFAPWWAGLDLRAVVFDTPYVDLRRAPNTRGVVGWGAHDPGAPSGGRPRGVWAEFERRFGPYPASKWTYGVPWPSPARAQAMGEALVEALEVRSRAARWLARERFPDWDLFIAVLGEPHGAVEGLWHGVDAGHPLHAHPSAIAASGALADIHGAVDRLIGEAVSVAGDAAIVTFTMGGMGRNLSDVASMVLLPELLYRDAFGRALIALPPEWTKEPSRLPILDEETEWSSASRSWAPADAPASRSALSGRLRSIARRLPPPVQGALRAARGGVAGAGSRGRPIARHELDWQPAMRYARYWPTMIAFALPSFYDGRIRINLKGRERDGTVEPARYEETCRALEAMLRECRDPATGEPVVASIERAWTRDPLALTGSEADLVVVWRGIVAALEHPRLGVIGPIPLRRTGGHTGPHGFAYIAAPGVTAGDGGVRSAFDVVPTMIKMLGKDPPANLSGTNLI